MGYNYSPALGRWVERDPIGFSALDNNLYRYESNGPQSHLDPNGLQPPPKGGDPKRSCEMMDLLLKDGYKLDKGTNCITISLKDYLAWRKKHGYPALSDALMEQLRRGCIGLAAAGQACDPSTGKYSDRPEDALSTKCYWTEAEARTRKYCPLAKYYFAVMGRLNDDKRWIVPNADGSFNYVAYNAGCYMDMNCGAGFGVEQTIRFCEKHPGPGGTYPQWMWCVTCKACEENKPIFPLK